MTLGLIGFIFILVGVCYFYLPNVIINIFQFIKKHLLNEKVVILNNKKIGLFFILVGLVLIFLLVKDKAFLKNELYSAYKEYYSGNFDKAEKICLNLLNKNPNDTDAMFLLGKVYFSSGKYYLAKATFLRINSISPKRKNETEKFLNLIEVRLQKNEN